MSNGEIPELARTPFSCAGHERFEGGFALWSSSWCCLRWGAVEGRKRPRGLPLRNGPETSTSSRVSTNCRSPIHELTSVSIYLLNKNWKKYMLQSLQISPLITPTIKKGYKKRQVMSKKALLATWVQKFIIKILKNSINQKSLGKNIIKYFTKCDFHNFLVFWSRIYILGLEISFYIFFIELAILFTI